MADIESPFVRVPEPAAGPRPTPVTYEQQVASIGAFAVGLQSRPSWVRWTVRAVALVFAAALFVAAVWGLVA